MYGRYDNEQRSRMPYRCPDCSGVRWQFRPRLCYGTPATLHPAAKMRLIDASPDLLDTPGLEVQ